MRIEQGLIALSCALLLVACGGDDDGAATGAPGTPPGPTAGDTGGTGGTTPPPASQLPVDPMPTGGTYQCRNVTLLNVRIDNLEVPAGFQCALRGTQLIGTAKVNQGSFLDARDVRMNGNIQSQGAAHIVLSGASWIGGSVQIEQGQSATLQGARIDGDIQLTSNRGALLAENNQVGQNIQVKQNLGGVTLNNNRAIGNLECQANQPAPTGGGNVAALKTDQCRAL
jgi:hypothetical protein